MKRTHDSILFHEMMIIMIRERERERAQRRRGWLTADKDTYKLLHAGKRSPQAGKQVEGLGQKRLYTLQCGIPVKVEVVFLIWACINVTLSHWRKVSLCIASQISIKVRNIKSSLPKNLEDYLKLVTWRSHAIYLPTCNTFTYSPCLLMWNRVPFLPI